MSQRLGRTVAVVRSFCEPRIAGFVHALRAFVPGVVVVVNNENDKGETRRLLGNLCDPHVHVLETFVKEGNRGWSGLLNQGLAFVRGLNAAGAGIEFVFNVSNTTSFSKSAVEMMLEGFRDPDIGIVGTTFDGILETGEAVELGTSYDHPRNTGMIIRMSVFDSHPLLSAFDPIFDGSCGMEDFDFIMKMERMTAFRSSMLELNVPLLVGRHWNQVEKRAFMEDGLARIKEHHRKMGWA